MSTNLRVTFNTIDVTTDGDPLDKGELYWSLKVDGVVVSSRSSANPYKADSGSIINLGGYRDITKGDAATLTISCTVSEKDDMDPDETDTHSQGYTQAGNWGIGNHRVNLVDSNMNIWVDYTISRR
jgi:hypothetical protein